MSEEPTSTAEAGERLAEARRARDISVGEIARELHLDDAKVRALEQNDFDRLGAPVFVKGYLRKYASLIGLSGDDILADYLRLKPSETAPPIMGLRAHPKPGTPPGPWIAAVAVAGVAAAAAWWWFASGTAVPDRANSTAGPALSSEPAEPEAAGDRPALEVIGESEAPDAAPAAQPEVEDAPPPRPPATDRQTADAVVAGQEEPADADAVPVAGQVALQLSFSGDCWTEVTDAGGNRLYFGLGTEGRTVAVDGTPPLQVLVGDSENVRVTIDGVPYSIPRSARRGDTARFTVTP